LEIQEPVAPLAASNIERQEKALTSEPLVEGRIVVQAVQCKKQGATEGGRSFATIEVNRIPDRLAVYESSSPSVSPRDGVVLLEGVKLTARQRTFDCFGSGDLEITTAGDLKIASYLPLTITALQDPPRLLLSPLID
jgi:hypothetical protein